MKGVDTALFLSSTQRQTATKYVVGCLVEMETSTVTALLHTRSSHLHGRVDGHCVQTGEDDRDCSQRYIRQRGLSG